jgi:tyrosyl-tRNA synthetase
MSAQDLLILFSKFSLNQILAHETFSARLKKGQPLALHEIMYPVLQGYDSVAVQADVELGGMDQKFNVLAGREAQRIFNQDQQDVLLLQYLRGTDGKQKMSKTAGNFIALDDSAAEMYGKLMSVPDALVWEYFELAAAMPLQEIDELKKQLKKKEVHPRDVKALMAKSVVSLYFGTSDIEYAETHFDDVHRKKVAPADMPTITLRGSEHNILNILVSHQLATSRSEARRMVEQGGVRLNQQSIDSWEHPVTIKNNSVLQVGKRRFVKIFIS